ncbi:MAG: ribonuclease activity regulator RraA [Acidobacteria bacterium]|nr:ribonuclease activity regulator RraA [Acidobacteriota bacterium]
MRILSALLAAGALCAQPTVNNVKAPERSVPAHVASKLSAADRVLFDKLMRVGLEAAWSAVTQEGYPLCFINELTPLHGDRRLVGRARTARYLPNRKDLREKLYGAGPQLNYRTAEEAQAGDVLVFDAGGETKSTVSGAMVTTRFLMKGGAGILVDGCMRDVPDLAVMPASIYLRCGHASSVSPLLMSVDYQVPVRIGGVTVMPGDYLVGERHGVLVIPASIVEKVLEKVMEHDQQEEFQRKLLLEGEPIYGVYPTLNEANRKKFEEWKKK